jgi:D-glycero-D-manno-heptose 1,7-bisphosphate phosphatase
MKPAVFLDRDGTLVREVGYLDRLDRLEMFPFSVDAVRLLNRAGLPVVVVSNQSGIGRGLIAPKAVDAIHASIGQRMRDGGARIDAFLFCPHHPEAALDEYRRVCECRKPAPGMLHDAARAMALDLSRSTVVGDRWDDVRAARAAGARGVLVRTGYGHEAERARQPGVDADATTDNLAGAVAWILQQA